MSELFLEYHFDQLFWRLLLRENWAVGLRPSIGACPVGGEDVLDADRMAIRKQSLHYSRARYFLDRCGFVNFINGSWWKTVASWACAKMQSESWEWFQSRTPCSAYRDRHYHRKNIIRLTVCNGCSHIYLWGYIITKSYSWMGWRRCY
jgi:hypothetical protein